VILVQNHLSLGVKGSSAAKYKKLTLGSKKKIWTAMPLRIGGRYRRANSLRSPGVER